MPASEKAKAESVARGKSGTRTVRNLIQVIPDTEREAVSRNDDEIRRDLEAALQADLDLSVTCGTSEASASPALAPAK